MRLLIRFGATVLALGALLWLGLAIWPDLAAWARAQQRELQTALARGVQAVRSGEPAALWGLIGASAFYGLAHAVGPGHGKLLIGGAAVASRRTAWRMAGIGMAASLTQGLTAILLVYGGLSIFAVSSGWAIGATERYLAPLSFGAVALVGLWIAARGARGLLRTPRMYAHGHDHHDHDHAHDHDHDHENCRHGPTPQEVERVEGWRDALALIASIGVRPCSGALIVLAIAWKLRLWMAGAASALAMALGTGAVVAGVALAAGAARDAGALREASDGSRRLFSVAQIAAGLAVAVLSAAFLWAALDAPASGGVLGPRG